jgi:hypothetical protein
MRQSSTHAAETRAAQAALTRPLVQDFDRFLLIDDSEDDTTEIVSLLRERSPRGLELMP